MNNIEEKIKDWMLKDGWTSNGEIYEKVMPEHLSPGFDGVLVRLWMDENYGDDFGIHFIETKLVPNKYGELLDVLDKECLKRLLFITEVVEDYLLMSGIPFTTGYNFGTYSGNKASAAKWARRQLLKDSEE